MADQADNLSAGTQVVSRVELRGTNNSPVHPRGAMGLVARTPTDEGKGFLVRFPDRVEPLQWPTGLHRNFERVLAEAKPPKRPDCEAANRFLVKARREMATPGRVAETGSVC